MKKLAVLLFLIVLTISFAGCSETSTQRIERITGYELPNDMEEIYYFLDETFTGCAGQYSVYNLDKEPECITTANKEEKLSITENERANIESFSVEYFNVPKEYQINFNEPYTYVKGKEETYIMYFPNAQRLIVCMIGH